MTLEVAIEILEAMAEDNDLETETKALALGIEALMEIQRDRLNGYRFVAVRLHGETDS
jgi:hypothetical protein